MFKFTKVRTVWWPVTVSVPQDGGNVARYTLEAQFELLPQSEQNAIFDAGGQDIDLLRRVLRGWRKMQDESGADLPFNADTFKEVMDEQYVRAGFSAAYMLACMGREAARKNS